MQVQQVQQKALTFWNVVQGWREDMMDFARTSLPKIVFIVFVCFILIRALKAITRRLNRFSDKQELPAGVRAQQMRTLAGVVNSVGAAVIVFLALMQILPVVGINMGPLLASAGVAGLAIGFGAQTLVKDVINGFFILIENQYDIGDVVKISNFTGKVEELTLRRTLLRDADGTLHIIPNSNITVVSNMTRDWVQVSMQVGVNYNEPSDKVIGLLKEIANGLRHDPQYADSFVAEPEVPGIDRISPGEATYLVLIKTQPGEQWATQRELRRRIKQQFEANNIQPPPLSRAVMVEPAETVKK